MDRQERLRLGILAAIVTDFPQEFWLALRTGGRQVYLDTFHQVQADPALVDEQRIDLLLQLRHFRMEHLLTRACRDATVDYSAKILSENSRHYVYATKGAVGITQAYVQAIGGMPNPARYRGRLAEMNQIALMPRLDLGDELPAVLTFKDFYAVLAHNPVGRRFTEADQRLGMMQFCVPLDDFSEWAVQFSMEEIIAAYPSAKPAAKPEREPIWKVRPEEKKEEA